MPTNKNPIQYILDDDYFRKFLEIQKKTKRRSSSNLSRYIVEKYIDEYENKHGEIEID